MKIQLTKEQRVLVQRHELDILIEFDKICRMHHINYSLCGGTLIGAVRHKGFIPWDDDIDVYVLRQDLEKIRKIFSKELGKKFFYQCNQTEKEYFYPFDKIRLNGTSFKSTALANRNINHGIFIDIFPIDVVPDNKLLSNIQYYEHRCLLIMLLAKFIDPNSQTGKKKLLTELIRSLTSWIDIQKIYNLEEKVASKYNSKFGTTKYVRNFNIPISYGKRGTYLTSWFRNYKTLKFENYDFEVIEEYKQLLKKVFGDYMKLPPIDKRCTQHDLSDIKL